MTTQAFEAMGCAVLVEGATQAEQPRIEGLFAERDRIFSRFRPDSELNRVNGSRALVVEVSAEFAEMTALALRVARKTNGLVDPTLGAAVEATGYDRDFGELRPDPRPPSAGSPGRWQSVRVARRWLSRPPGLRLDLNGVVKSRTVDDALRLIAGAGFVGAGGDLATRLPVDIALPGGGAVRLVRGGIATSGRVKRRWLRAGVWHHHLIDPHTGRASGSSWLEVTAGAGTCLRADVAAKAAFLLSDAGPAWLDVRGLAGRFVAPDRMVETAAWRQALELAAA